MSLDRELQDLFGRIQDAPWPGEHQAFNQFLRRRARRGRALAAGLVVTLVAVLAAAVLVPRLLPDDIQPVVPVAPAGRGMRIADQGFQLAAPGGWRVSRKMTRSLGPMPYDGRLVEGVVLVPSAGSPSGVTITVTTEDHEPDWQGASRRPDGRQYLWRPSLDPGVAGRYLVQWPNYCRQDRAMAITTCSRAGQPRALLVTGYAPDDTQRRAQLQQVMGQLALSIRPITNGLRPPPTPTVSPQTKVLLGTGGSGASRWEAWIEPFDRTSAAGFAVRFPHATPKPVRRWEQLEPSILNGQGTYTFLECLSWRRRPAVVVVGLARADAAMVQIELSKRPLVEVPVFGRGKSVPMGAFASPPLPADVLVNRATAFDASGRLIGSENLKAMSPCRGLG
jgi:hypothetical protein